MALARFHARTRVSCQEIGQGEWVRKIERSSNKPAAERGGQVKRRVKGDEEGGEMGRVRETTWRVWQQDIVGYVSSLRCSLENQRLRNLYVSEQCISQTYVGGMRAVQQSVETCTSRVLSVT